jgi:hypothetical protein
VLVALERQLAEAPRLVGAAGQLVHVGDQLGASPCPERRAPADRLPRLRGEHGRLLELPEGGEDAARTASAPPSWPQFGQIGMPGGVYDDRE